MNDFRPTLSGLGSAPAAARSAPTAAEVAAATERQQTPTTLANAILKALDGRMGWTPAGVLREAINPRDTEQYKYAIKKLRDAGMIESTGHTRWVQYRITAKAKPPAKPVAVPPPSPPEPPQESVAPTPTLAPAEAAPTPPREYSGLSPELRLMSSLDRLVVEQYYDQVDPEAIARAATWLASKYRSQA